MTIQNPANKRNPAIAAFLAIIFAVPWSDGSPGQVLAMSFMFTAFTLAVLWIYRKQPFSVLDHLKSRHKTAWFLLWGWLAASSISLILVLVSNTGLLHKGLATYRHFSILLFMLYVFALARFCSINRLSHIHIFTALTAGMMMLLFLYVLIYHFGPTPNPRIWGYFPPLGSHVRNIGNVAAVTCVITSMILINNIFKSRLHNCLMAASALSIWSFLVWNGGRSSMAAAIITSVLLMIFSLYFAKARIRACLLVIAIIVAGFATGDHMSVFRWNGLQRSTHVIQTNAAENSALANDAFTSGRMTMWSISLNELKKSPWFGLGPYGYYFIPGKTFDDQPHNLIIQFMVEWGIIGTSFMLGLLGYCAFYGLKQLPSAFRERDFSYIAGASVILLLTLDSMTAGTYFKMQPMICIATAYAVFPFGRRKVLHNSAEP